MEIKLDHIHSPCIECWLNMSSGFDPEAEICQSCNYNIVEQLLKYVIKYKFDCKFCHNCIDEGFGFLRCKYGEEYHKKCEKENLIYLDYDSLVNALRIEVLSGKE